MLRTRLQKKLNANMDDIWSLDVLPVAFNAVFYSSYSCCILTVRILGLVFTGSYYSNSNVASLSGPVVSVHFTLFYFFYLGNFMQVRTRHTWAKCRINSKRWLRNYHIPSRNTLLFRTLYIIKDLLTNCRPVTHLGSKDSVCLCYASAHRMPLAQSARRPHDRSSRACTS